MKFKNLLSIIAASCITFTPIESKPAIKTSQWMALGKICYLEKSPNGGNQIKYVNSLEADLDGDNEKEYLSLRKPKESEIIGEYCGYMFSIKDINYLKDTTMKQDIYNIAAVELFPFTWKQTSSEYLITLHICTTESEEVLTGKGDPEIVDTKHYIWNGEKLVELKELK